MEAFIAGGDFHSRTAMNMYQYIREAVEQKKVLLEWHPQPGQEKPPVPLLKVLFVIFFFGFQLTLHIMIQLSFEEFVDKLSAIVPSN